MLIGIYMSIHACYIPLWNEVEWDSEDLRFVARD